MARRPSLEDRLSRLAELRAEPDSDANLRELRKCLGGRIALLASRAAELVGELGLDDLTGDLVAAFDRFLADPVRADKGCVAKTAIARALVQLEAREDDVYLKGLRLRQMEPSWGEPVDTAVALRSTCAEGLLLARHPDLVLELVELLVDPEPNARVAAARELGASGRPAAEPVLRLAAHKQDSEPEVMGEIFASLLAVAPRRSLPFVAGFLDSGTDSRSGASAIAEAAALALGESRLEEAVPVLREAYEICFDFRMRQTLLLAISASRREAGLEMLISLVEDAGLDRAEQAIVALAIHRDESLLERAEAALADRADAADLRVVLARNLA